MVKKSLLPVMLFVFILLASGCTLVKGTGGAAVGLTQGAAGGASEGFKDDVGFVKKADSWVKSNLW